MFIILHDVIKASFVTEETAGKDTIDRFLRRDVKPMKIHVRKMVIRNKPVKKSYYYKYVKK